MSQTLLVLSLLALVTCVNSRPFEGVSLDNPGQLHAVLLSTVPCDLECNLNYLAEAEIAQTYHFLRDNGVPEQNIILFMNGGIANNTEVNPFPGTLYTDLNKSRNYNEGLKIDYIGDQVNVNNYLAVLSGDKDKVKGGSGRVLSSTSNDRVFVSHESHGGDGVLLIGENEVLSAKELKGALEEANKKKLFRELTYYIMACRSGSMFNGWLPADGNIYALTAAQPGVDTYAYQYITEIIGKKIYTIYLNTEFGHGWLSDSNENDTTKQTLEEQFKIVYPQVSSHPSQYGNLNITSEPLSNFQGDNNNSTRVGVKTFHVEDQSLENADPVFPISPISVYLRLKNQVQKSKLFSDSKDLVQRLEKMEKEQIEIQQKVDAIVNSFAVNSQKFALLKSDTQTPPQMITQLDCHHDVVKAIYSDCRQIIKSPFIRTFVTPMVNLCEKKFDTQTIVAQIRKQCPN